MKKDHRENQAESTRPLFEDAGKPPIATETFEHGRRALDNCDEMRAVNTKMLDQNHDLMTGVRRKMDAWKVERENKPAIRDGEKDDSGPHEA